MIRRETDPALANAVSRMEGVLANVSYDGREIDWAPAIDTCVVLSNGEDAIQVWEQKSRHVWEVMTIFGPSCRGRKAIETGIAMRDYMAPYTDLAFGSIPNTLPQAKWFYRKLGGRPVSQVETVDAVYVANPGETLFEYRPGPYNRS